MVRRFGLSMVAAAVVLLLCEGVLSLVWGRSLRGGATASRPAPAPLVRTDAERLRAAGDIGLLRTHVDPLVGNVLKPGVNTKTSSAVCSVDTLGARGRPGAAPGADAQRIVVLGDSVAFGQGVNDDQTIAYQLERMLARVRGAAVNPAACWTVAVPGWNHRNAVQFLIDHFSTYDPEVVIYIPVDNDMVDTFGVTAGGDRRVMYDIASHDPWLSVSLGLGLVVRVAQERKTAAGPGWIYKDADFGPVVVVSDLTMESRRRYDANAASIARLDELLARQGRKLLLMYYQEETYLKGYVWILRERILDLGRSIPEVPGMRKVPASLRLPGNPHPNAEGNRAMASWIAQEVLKRGWVPDGGSRDRPDVPEDARVARAGHRTEAVIRERAALVRARALARMQAAIELDTGRGCMQIYGGINPDATMGARMAAALKPAGRAMSVRLEAIAEAPHLYPLRVHVEIDGISVGSLTVPGSRETGFVEGIFELPQREDLNAPFEVHLIPEEWTVTQFQGRSQLSSCRVAWIRSVAGE